MFGIEKDKPGEGDLQIIRGHEKAALGRLHNTLSCVPRLWRGDAAVPRLGRLLSTEATGGLEYQLRGTC